MSIWCPIPGRKVGHEIDTSHHQWADKFCTALGDVERDLRPVAMPS